MFVRVAAAAATAVSTRRRDSAQWQGSERAGQPQEAAATGGSSHARVCSAAQRRRRLPQGPAASARMGDQKYFSTTKKGEIAELKEELNHLDRQKKKDAVRPVLLRSSFSLLKSLRG